MKTAGPSGKGILKVKTFRVPIERDKDGKVTEKQVELTDDMLKGEPEEKEFKSPMLEIPTFTKELGQFNKRQVLIAENNPDKDYILKKILTK